MRVKVQTIVVVLAGCILRWCVTYHPYSGEGQPPMYGDYEAQRHWQEITLNLPVEEWYKNSTQNDLQYWGLDYPPLTAYHSNILGRIAHKINPKYVALHESRGFESQMHKYFMRLTVLAADLFIFVPAALYFVFSCVEKPKEPTPSMLYLCTRPSVLAVILFYPGLIIIDYGHFQYNCVSLGAFVAAVAAILGNFHCLGSLLFVLGLNYKQMELYHALPCFIYILAVNKFNRTLFCVTCTVIGTFAAVWWPFIWDQRTFLSVIIRLFPLARGVFEDKVANFWCTINVVYKLRDTFENLLLAQICLFSTTIALLPSSLDMLFRPSKEKFIISQINSSLAFFLFSYQVHEKSILLAAIPVLLYFHKDRFACLWFLLISTFSMLPLIIKDQLFLSHCTLTVFFYISVTWIWFSESFFSMDSDKILNAEEQISKNISNKKSKLKKQPKDKKSQATSKAKKHVGLMSALKNYLSAVIDKETLIIVLFYLSMGSLVVLTFISRFMQPPKQYPDLFPLLVSVFSCGHFVLFFIYFNYRQFTLRTGQKLKSNVKLKMN
ncbi:dolichyl pyrophosphate Man9GlcNAc2 alpha-1,3-glucosyltransferase [Belonocnema kinseyi]|uniref:dolichyl pyrophosphate Man9GlcNAc2 alpha-1,3-glucosyltransferase n=1 Tax=Belonocnema kinseyi TaxID=2817044 RepID=UPI00143DDBB4|nr:dolichyl pyrophosphate Man9GlcNAc2 alpha-1,3-glucosyltransferase [Belonocnema kinseyi]XP_033207246.1 dolichyl pyrophosphate Man9GlcNAc2 alpha-1,3-glucosyltransferase [Belonocnema kinseyi]XP_033207247.1 dolichyl pyrophosphate Man9GlcNAc2 alpha-1,3-glucosyltransferase [Belonocnema kinseyi]